jgi:large subunit ribosomal protein L3
MKTFYTIKSGETHTFDKNGKRLLVTKLSAKPLTVVQVKTTETDGYKSLQVAIGENKRVTKPLAGHLKKANVTPKYLREITVEQDSKQVGETVTASEIFEIGDRISVKSKMKGKGFAGVVKRHGFHGGPKTHGQTDRLRAPGSIGQGTDPGRIWKGKKMAGHMGNVYVNTKGGQVIKIDEENNELWITGTVPGPKGQLVQIEKVKKANFVGLPETKKEEPKAEPENNTETKEETR